MCLSGVGWGRAGAWVGEIPRARGEGVETQNLTSQGSLKQDFYLFNEVGFLRKNSPLHDL